MLNFYQTREFKLSIYSYLLVSAIVFLHSRLCFELVSKIVEKSKFHFLQYLFCAMNGLLAFGIFIYLHEFTSYHYLALVIILFIQTRVLFVTHGLVVAITTTILLLHLFVFRAITISCYALSYDITIAQTISDPMLFWVTTLISFVSHNVAIILFIKLIPAKHLKTMIKEPNVVCFFFIIGALLMAYMIFNASFYSISNTAIGIRVQQIILPLVLLSVFYISLLMMLRIVSLQGFKEKATELEDTIIRESGIKSALFNMTKVFAEFNCTKDELRRLVIYEKDADITKYSSYSDFLHRTSKRYMHSEDLYKSKSAEASNIIELFNKGITEVSYEYRTPVTTEGNNNQEYLWHKLMLQSKLDEQSNDIIAFFLIYTIHDEKEVKIALQNKAESDPLTGGYNKEAAQTYINQHLEEKKEGTFFVIDLDNFKPINDNFGHSYGDDVLCSVYNEIRSHFRNNDIIARVGGDEFIAFTPDILSLDSLKAKARQICSSIKKEFTTDIGIKFALSASIGISHAPDDGTEYKDLFDNADKAMYVTKKSGKNSYTIFTPNI